MQNLRSLRLLSMGALLLVSIACTDATIVSGTRTKGGASTPSTGQAFAELDQALARRFLFMLDAASQLDRSIFQDYRRTMVDITLPMLRRRANDARQAAREAVASFEANGRAEKLRRAGAQYQALLLISQGAEFGLVLGQIANLADAAGQPSGQLVQILASYDHDIQPVYEAAASMDSARMAKACSEEEKVFERWVHFLARWTVTLEKGAVMSRNARLIADIALMVYAAYEMGTLAAEYVAMGPPSSGGFVGEALAVSAVDTAQLARLMEAIRQLIAAGALDAAVIGGIGGLVGEGKAFPSPPAPPMAMAPRRPPGDGGKPTPDLSKVQKVNGRMPQGSGEYTDGVYDQLSPELEVKYPKSVKFDENGFPDFSPYRIQSVRVKGLTGNRAHDSALANEAAGLTSTPKGYTWHHHQDGVTMELVPRDLHTAVPHTGGAAVIRGKVSAPTGE